jgi:hypothetical protein
MYSIDEFVGKNVIDEMVILHRRKMYVGKTIKYCSDKKSHIGFNIYLVKKISQVTTLIPWKQLYRFQSLSREKD